jgi:hypothetical protein
VYSYDLATLYTEGNALPVGQTRDIDVPDAIYVGVPAGVPSTLGIDEGQG